MGNTEIDLFKTPEGREEAAKDFVFFLEDDDSQPVSHRDKWKGEAALRKFESQIVATFSLYREWADFCRRAQKHVRVPTIRCLFQINRINGLRRLPEGERDDSLILQLFDDSQLFIEALPDSPRKTRLESLWDYNSSVYNRVTGNYVRAAELAERSATKAKAVGDLVSAAISYFAAQIERFNDALLKNIGIQVALANLKRARAEMDGILNHTSDPTSVRWMYLNAPIHMLFAHVLCDIPYEDGTADLGRLTFLQRPDPDLFQQHAAGIAFANAAHDYIVGDLNGAFFSAATMVDKQWDPAPSPEYLAACYIILARIKLTQAKKEEVAEYYVAAKEIHGSAHQVRAVAARELEALLKE